jgi:thiol-disulfide isomerase/thioredoxin
MNKIITIIIVSFYFLNVVSAQNIPKWKVTDFKHYADTANSELIVINLWATFCKPCVEEIPDLIRVSEKYKGKLSMVFVSLDTEKDYPRKLNRFIKKHHFKFNAVWLDETNADYFCPSFDSSWSGSIPATLFISKKTNSRLFIESEMSADEFEQHIQSFLLEKK